jgi:integrase/recombinase XerD
MSFAVQRLRSTDDGRVSFTVIGPDGLPVEPAEAFLAHLSAKGASPNTVAGYAHDLRDFLAWLLLRGAGFRELSVEDLAEFFAWLRRPKAARAAGVLMLPGAPAALENSTLTRKRAAVASFYRFHARRDESVPALLGELTGARPTGRYQPMLIHTRRRGPGPDAGSPIRMPAYRKPPKTLTSEELRRLKDSCTCLRDLFLLAILEETGIFSGGQDRCKQRVFTDRPGRSMIK